MFHTEIMMSVLQAMQLAALVPCLFVVAFLSLVSRSGVRVIVPSLYFLVLAAGFVLPLLGIWPEWSQGRLYRGLIFAQSLLPALSFLLIIQFASGNVPRAVYWLILALPLVGGSSLVYASLLSDTVCLRDWGCVSATDIKELYAIISTAFIFLLLMAIYVRTRPELSRHDKQAHQRYWLILALIVLNLCSMGVALWRLHGTLSLQDALFIDTVLRITFIYVVLTLLFRVFDRKLADALQPQPQPEAETIPNPQQQARDGELIARFAQLLEQERIYAEMECSRDGTAAMLGISGNTLSRIINQHYQARFTDVINRYRVRDAQRLLCEQPEMAVTDIAFAVGFNSIPSFNRVFKQHTGKSPSAYRQGKKA